ncbi:MAG: hypothetical protein RSB52_02655 [Acidaminococcaceae bacterium]
MFKEFIIKKKFGLEPLSDLERNFYPFGHKNALVQNRNESIKKVRLIVAPQHLIKAQVFLKGLFAPS